MIPRQTEILDLLRRDERVLVRDLARRFAISEMTVRRDLTDLEKQGFVVRTHGGALPASKLRFLQRAFPHYMVSAEKAAIGKVAAQMVSPGQTIMVDTGTTALEVARNLPQGTGITVATTSICVAQELYGSQVQVLLLGGIMRREFPSLYGPLTETALRSYHVDILFIGCDGADSTEGFYTADLHISSLEQAMIGIADRVIVVTESSKFGKKAMVRYAVPEQVHTLVTDPSISAQDQQNLIQRGVNVIIAREE